MSPWSGFPEYLDHMQNMPIRRLNPVEEAFTLMNNAYPFNAVIVLRIRSDSVSDEVISRAFDKVRHKHRYLNYQLTQQKGHWYFSDPGTSTEFQIGKTNRTTESSYLSAVENALNTSLAEGGPLCRLIYVAAAGETDSELVLGFHHSLVDSSLLRILLDDIMSALGQGFDPERSTHQINCHDFSTDFHASLWRKTGFMRRQLQDELLYTLTGVRRQAAVSSKNSAYTMRFSEHETRAILLACHNNGVSLNCFINAALLLSTLENNHPGMGNTRCRTMTFADLRSTLFDAGEPVAFGCFIAMLRYTLQVAGKEDLVSVAKKLQKAMFASARNQELPLFYSFAPQVASLTIRRNSGRMGVSALSFIGDLRLGRRYGEVDLLDVQAYISNNRLGPEFSGFGKILFGRIGLDFCALESETTPEKARKIISDTRELLLAQND